MDVVDKEDNLHKRQSRHGLHVLGHSYNFDIAIDIAIDLSHFVIFQVIWTGKAMFGHGLRTLSSEVMDLEVQKYFYIAFLDNSIH